MNMYPTLTDIRGYLSYQFSALHTRALRDSLWAKLSGRNTRLAVFPEQAPQKSPNKVFLGVQEVPVDRIVGTVNRQSDFDHKFRPLKKSLRERWINARLTLDREGWSPALLHRVGEHYYVEDGHHRVSVAQALGMGFIQASVWEYPCLANGAKPARVTPCREQSQATVYAGAAEQA
jgi:hypothetical protein